MKTYEQALYEFWASFGLTTYEENSVPIGADAPSFPYLTYSISNSGFNSEYSLTVNIWTRSTSWISANLFADTIFKFIGMGGKCVNYKNGVIWLKRGTPFSQSLGDESDDMIKRKYINITAENITAN